MTDARNLLVRLVTRPLRWFRPATRFLIGFLALAMLVARTPPNPGIDSEERGIGYRRLIEVPISKGGEVEDEALSGKGKG